MKQEIKDYVLFVLGAPLVKVELDDRQLDCAVDMALETVAVFSVFSESAKADWKKITAWLAKKGALAYAKLMLGHVRRKFSVVPSPSGCVALDGQQLVEEAYRDLQAFEKEVVRFYFKYNLPNGMRWTGIE